MFVILISKSPPLGGAGGQRPKEDRVLCRKDDSGQTTMNEIHSIDVSNEQERGR